MDNTYNLNKKTIGEIINQNLKDSSTDIVNHLKDEANTLKSVITDPISHQINEFKWMIDNDKKHINDLVTKISIRGKITIKGIEKLKNAAIKKTIEKKEEMIETLTEKKDEIIAEVTDKKNNINNTIHNSMSFIKKVPYKMIYTMVKYFNEIEQNIDKENYSHLSAYDIPINPHEISNYNKLKMEKEDEVLEKSQPIISNITIEPNIDELEKDNNVEIISEENTILNEEKKENIITEKEEIITSEHYNQVKKMFNNKEPLTNDNYIQELHNENARSSLTDRYNSIGISYNTLDDDIVYQDSYHSNIENSSNFKNL